MYHGTSDKHWAKIRSEGLQPKVKTRTWADDPSATSISPSRASLESTYLTDNLMTAKSAAWTAVRNAKANHEVIVIVQAQPRSAFADEDDVSSALEWQFQKVFGVNPAESARYSTEFWMEYKFAPSSVRHYEDDYVKEVVDHFKKITGIEIDDKAMGILAPVLRSAVWVGIERVLAHFIEKPESSWSKPISAATDFLRNFSKTREEYKGKIDVAQADAEKMLSKIPSVSDAERKWLGVKDKVTRILRKIAWQQDSRVAHNIRIAEPITFSGRNKIIGAVLIFKTGVGMVEGLKVLYGSLPEKFKEDWNKAVGPRDWTSIERQK